MPCHAATRGGVSPMSGMLSRRHQENCSAGTKAGDLGVSLGYGPYGYDLGGSACHVTPLPGAVSRQCRGCCHVDIRETVAPAQKPAT
ncbi:MAG: hypothetical protein KGZ50_05205, partial [Peptococcaceae bacterium]|nr:hypothetical protein [Peptococcaceae bacterium]